MIHFAVHLKLIQHCNYSPIKRKKIARNESGNLIWTVIIQFIILVQKSLMYFDI